jgi:hypothetical protein
MSGMLHIHLVNDLFLVVLFNLYIEREKEKYQTLHSYILCDFLQGNSAKYSYILYI